MKPNILLSLKPNILLPTKPEILLWGQFTIRVDRFKLNRGFYCYLAESAPSPTLLQHFVLYVGGGGSNLCGWYIWKIHTNHMTRKRNRTRMDCDKRPSFGKPGRNRRIAPSTNWDTTSMSLPSAAYLPAVAVGMGSEGLDLYRFLALNQSVSL